MNDYMKVDTVTAIGSMITILGTVVGMVVWLVKQQTARQNDVSDRYFKHLEDRATNSERIHERYADSFQKVGESISRQTVEISKQTVQLGELTGKVGGLAESVAKNQCKGTPKRKPAARKVKPL